MGAILGSFLSHRFTSTVDASDPAIRAADADNPLGTVPEAADGSMPVDTKGASYTLFALRLGGTGSTITVLPMFYDAIRKRFYADDAQAVSYDAPGHYLFEIKTRGLPVWLKITSLTGTAPDPVLAEIEFALVRERTIA